MRLSKTSWLSIVIGLVVIVLIILGNNYWKQAEEKRQVEEELASAKQTLAGINNDSLDSQKGQLQTQLVQINSQMKNTGARLSKPLDSIATSNALLDTAETYNVKITNIISSSISRDNLDGLAVTVMPIEMTAEGAPDNLVNFTLELGKAFPTAVINNVSLRVAESEAVSTVSIRMSIYQYQGGQK